MDDPSVVNEFLPLIIFAGVGLAVGVYMLVGRVLHMNKLLAMQEARTVRINEQLKKQLCK